MLRINMNVASARDGNLSHFFEVDRDYIPHPLHSEFFEKLYIPTRNLGMNNDKSSIEWNQSIDTSPNFFLGLLWIYTDKIATILNSQN